MHDQRAPAAAQEEAQEDSVVLGLLLGDREQRPWSMEETSDSLGRLHGAGLIHRLEGFAWASRAALRAEEIHV